MFLIYTDTQRINQPADQDELARYYEARDSRDRMLETTEGQVVKRLM